jgi:hypothetical protein
VVHRRRSRVERALLASRSRPALLLALVAVLVSSCGIVGGSATTSAPAPTSPYSRFAAVEQRALTAAERHVRVDLPTKPGQLAPALGTRPFGNGLGSRIVLGFLPSWELSDVPSLDYRALSEVAYYALEVRSDGAIVREGPGYDDLEAGEVSTLVADAHAAGTRVLLSLYSIDQTTLGRLASDPSSGTTLADQVAPLLSLFHFDGVDLDLEGQLASARAGFVGFVTAFSDRLRALDSTWSIVLNVLPQSGVDPESFFDVHALAAHVDDIFDMAYDMSDLLSPGATAPLTGAELSDLSSLASLVSTVPAEKLILGIPFYGYDFTASSRGLPAVTIGTPYAVTYDSILAAGRPALWDPVSETAYSSFERDGAWHQTWFDDPTSVALKVSLAASFNIAGVGAWDLGMANGHDEMTEVLDGGSPPRRLPLAVEP